jgi:DNA-3-methyladenine glycosylase II
MAKTNWSKATRHLRRDPVMKRVIEVVGPCTIQPQRDHFVLLCRAIYSQQISSKVAKVLFGRFCERFDGRRPTPAAVSELLSRADADMAGCGLSRQKRGYLMDLAQHFQDKRIPSRKLPRMSDEEIIEALTAVKGIGRWTAEMFLMFVLNRPDVLPVDDLGLQNIMKRAYGLRGRPKAAKMKKIAEAWRPYRTVASWYLWRVADLGDSGW